MMLRAIINYYVELGGWSCEILRGGAQESVVMLHGPKGKTRVRNSGEASCCGINLGLSFLSGDGEGIIKVFSQCQ